MKRPAFVFSIDAFFALIIFAALASLIVSLRYETSSTDYAFALHSLKAEDAVDVLSRVQVSEVRTHPPIKALVASGSLSISDLNSSVVDELGRLWAVNDSASRLKASQIADGTLGWAVPYPLDWSFLVENDELYSRGSRQNASRVAAASRLVSGYLASQPFVGYAAQFYLTLVAGSLQYAYSYFGGFIGEGNITVALRGLPGDMVPKSLYVEANAGDNVNLSVNNVSCGQLDKSASQMAASNWTISSSPCLAAFVPGDNNISLKFSGSNLSSQFIGGGYLRLAYTTSQPFTRNGTMRYYFPAIDGVFSVYDSFFVPGNVTSISSHLEFFNNQSTVFKIGSAPIFNASGKSFNQSIDNTTDELSAILQLSQLGNKTVPLRISVETPNMTGPGIGDIVLITDVSGSMDWRIGYSDETSGTIRDCNSSQLYNTDTQKLSLAKCLDKNFTDIILTGTGNRVALVSFSTSANSYTNLTDNKTLLYNTIGNYSASGGTCICCAINRAYNILNQQSDSKRLKFIVVMSDGIAGYHCGANESWQSFTSPTTRDLRDIRIRTATLGFGVGSSGRIIKWDGGSWGIETSGVSDNLYGIAFSNASQAFAVGSSGRIVSWTGSSWGNVSSSTTSELRSVSFASQSLGFAVGASGRIVKWNGSSWSTHYSPTSSTLYSIRMYNSSRGIAAGYGAVIQFNGSNWSSLSSPTSNYIMGVGFLNSSRFQTAGYQQAFFWYNPEAFDYIYGTGWTTISPGGTGTLYGLANLSSNESFFFGSGGYIGKWDGSSVYSVTSPTGNSLWKGEIFNSTFGFAVGDDGTIIKYTGPRVCNGTSTSGTQVCGGGSGDCNNAECSCAVQGAVNAAERAYLQLNATVDAIGFTIEQNCSNAAQAMQGIAQKGNGTYILSTNATALANFYSTLAQNITAIVRSHQSFYVIGNLTTHLYPNSFIEIQYTPENITMPYAQVRIPFESDRLPSCEGTLFIPAQFSVFESRVTSYSAQYWTDNVSVWDANSSTWKRVFDLSIYSSDYSTLGDPYVVEFSPSLLVPGQVNKVGVRTGARLFEPNGACSQYNRVIYSLNFTARVPFGGVFPNASGHNVSVSYDLNFDGTPDGNATVWYGEELPGFDPTLRTVDELDPSTNALDDAFLRLMEKLNVYRAPFNFGTSGSETNPVDVVPGRVGFKFSKSPETPYLWGPVEIRVAVWS